MTENRTTTLLLRIFVGEYDKLNHEPLYEQIVYQAKKDGLAGATVTKGIMSFGATSRIHKSKLLAISEDLPIVIEIVDDKPKIESFIDQLDELFEEDNGGGLITCEEVKVTFYGASKKG
jgi:PII-like signaling protein